MNILLRVISAIQKVANSKFVRGCIGISASIATVLFLVAGLTLPGHLDYIGIAGLSFAVMIDMIPDATAITTKDKDEDDTDDI